MRQRLTTAIHFAGALTLIVLGGCLPDSLLITPVRVQRALQERTLYTESFLPDGKIAVVDVDGVILNASERSFLTPGEHPVAHLLEELDKAARDPAVKAVVLRINSPGGSTTASELMYNELQRFRRTGKLVVAMMLDVAASGAYYIACAADEIVACRTTVTGSIGVIMQTLEVTGTMQKIGVRADAIKSGDQKGAGSPFATLTPAQREVFQNVVTELYEQFVDVVAAGRPQLARERIVELADGRIYTAPQALENGLIDRIGTVRDAIARAKELAQVQKAQVVAYARPYGYVPNYYAETLGAPATASVNLLNVNLGSGLSSAEAPFMYLWTHP